MKHIIVLLAALTLIACKKTEPATPTTHTPTSGPSYDTIRMTITQSTKDSIQNFTVDMATFTMNPPGAILVKSNLFEWGALNGDTNAMTGTEYIIYQNAAGDSVGVTGTCATGSVTPTMKVYVNSTLRATIAMPLVHPYGWCHQAYYAMKL